MPVRRKPYCLLVPYEDGNCVTFRWLNRRITLFKETGSGETRVCLERLRYPDEPDNSHSPPHRYIVGRKAVSVIALSDEAMDGLSFAWDKLKGMSIDIPETGKP